MALKKRGLGRGLDALLGNVELHEAGAESALQILPVEFLQRGKYQPRKDINPEKLQELADSIKVQGIVQPIVVRRLAAEKYEIVAGERRWRAAQLAGLSDVPVLVKVIDERSALAIALIENIQREDLNPLEEAEALKRLLDEFGMTHQQAAEAVGRSRVGVSNLLRLLELQPEVKQLLIAGQLEMGHARALLALSGEKQVAAAKKVAEGGLTVRAAEQLAKDLQAEKKPPLANAPDPDTVRLQNRLTEKLGARVVIAHQSNGGGKLVIAYASLDELDGVLKRIGCE
jgi:ParB family chromosome partitioning protein